MKSLLSNSQPYFQETRFPRSIPFCVRLHESEFAKLRRLATRHQTSMSHIVRTLIREVKEEKEKEVTP